MTAIPCGSRSSRSPGGAFAGYNEPERRQLWYGVGLIGLLVCLVARGRLH